MLSAFIIATFVVFIIFLGALVVIFVAPPINNLIKVALRGELFVSIFELFVTVFVLSSVIFGLISILI